MGGLSLLGVLQVFESLGAEFLLRPHGLQLTRFLYSWDSPGKNTGVGSHALLQGIFLTQEFRSRSLASQVDSLPS